MLFTEYHPSSSRYWLLSYLIPYMYILCPSCRVARGYMQCPLNSKYMILTNSDSTSTDWNMWDLFGPWSLHPKGILNVRMTSRRGSSFPAWDDPVVHSFSTHIWLERRLRIPYTPRCPKIFKNHHPFLRLFDFMFDFMWLPIGVTEFIIIASLASFGSIWSSRPEPKPKECWHHRSLWYHAIRPLWDGLSLPSASATALGGKWRLWSPNLLVVWGKWYGKASWNIYDIWIIWSYGSGISGWPSFKQTHLVWEKLDGLWRESCLEIHEIRRSTGTLMDIPKTNKIDQSIL